MYNVTLNYEINMFDIKVEKTLRKINQINITTMKILFRPEMTSAFFSSRKCTQ